MYKKLDEARDYTETAKGSLYVADENNKLALEMTTGTTIGADGKPRRRTGTAEDMKYYEDRQKNILETAKGFHTSKDGELRASLAYQKDAIGTKNTIQNAWIKGMISDGQAATEVWLDKVSEHYALTRSPQALSEMNKIVDNAKLKGFYDSKQAKDLLEKTLEKSNWSAFTQLAKTDGVEVARDAVANKEIKLTQEQGEKSLSYLNNLRQLQDKNAVISTIDTRIQLANDIASGKESIYDLSPAMKAKIQNDPVALAGLNIALKQYAKPKYSTGEPATKKYLDVLSAASKPNATAEELSALSTSIIYLNKNLPPDMMGALLFYNNQKAATSGISEKYQEPIDATTTEAKIKSQKIDAGMSSIGRWARHLQVPSDDVALTTTEYLNLINKDKKQPFEALNIAVKNGNLRAIKGMALFPKEGQILKDAMGNYVTAFPDGSMTPLLFPKPKMPTAPKVEVLSEKEEVVVPESLE